MFHILPTTLTPPARFTYPYYYTPDPLCCLAAEQVRAYIGQQSAWQAELSRGKMFGVLVCRDAGGHIGFLAAYSGLLSERGDWPWFVPLIYDSQQEDGTFKREERRLDALTRDIALAEADEQLGQLRARVCTIKKEAEADLAAARQHIAARKAARDAARCAGRGDEAARVRESQHLKACLRRRKQDWLSRIAAAELALRPYTDRLDALRRQRKSSSEALQRWLFTQYVVRNALGQSRAVIDLFEGLPPSGTGDCCAPKLLQHAYLHGLTPLCMAEFWYGASPRTTIRHDGAYYPACRGKCKPILDFMMQGLDVAPNPLAVGADLTVEVRYKDDYLAVVEKPAGLLSVPGRDTHQPSVSALVARLWPEAACALPVHRLDMATSGLLLIALTPSTFVALQRLFAQREVTKRYLALVDGIVRQRTFTIALPLRPDPLDRPRQVVDVVHGKPALTRGEILRTIGARTLVRLTPETGRTHQLRVHCAHPEGLGLPILGDALYGTGGGRLCLHAAELTFRHPQSGEWLTFNAAKPDFI